MPSKGVHVYAFIAVPDCKVTFSVPGEAVEANEPNTFFTHLLEVDKAKLGGVFKMTGRFSFQVNRGDTTLTKQWIEINAVTGSLSDGTMKNMSETPSIVQDDLIITYGFYDAGSGGESGLTSMDQCYVTVTPNYSRWQEELVPPGSDDKPFSRFVLPAAHDVGMNTMQNAVALLAHSGDAIIKMVMERFKLTGQLHFGLGDKAIAKIAPAIIVSLSITQKDTLPTMLAIGARYFEFRPAFCVDKAQPNMPIPDSMYFQHACIPGMAFEEFLEDVVTFLVEHQHEIVVTQLRYDGILAGCRRPTDQELDDVINKALEGKCLVRGTVDDMHNMSINELRSTGRRFIIFNPVSSFSTYTDEANATTNGDTIIQQFEQMSAERQSGQAFTNIQCQATATNIRNAVIYSALSANASNSCLMSTKAICDAKTLPWIRDHALEKLTEEQLIVCMVCRQICVLVIPLINSS